jgi:DNA-binding NtrC family response regulator
MTAEKGRDVRAKIVLFGLDDSLESELRGVLVSQQQTVISEPFLSPPECLAVVDRAGAALVFCASHPQRYPALLDAVGRLRPDLPVVVVSRAPEVAEWLDAIEAGACDYCAPPFETAHIRWILDSALIHHSTGALYRAAG